MSDGLGLSVGTTNLVAVSGDSAPITRRSVLTLFNDRAPEVGEYAGPNQPRLVLTGFVERVGDPVPLVASDGSSHRGEIVLVEALDAIGRAAGGGSPVTIAVPAHWGPGVVGALRSGLRAKPALAPGGVPPTLIPDSAAALAGLRAGPGLPPDGVVVLCDFGASGTSITLADAHAGLAVIGDTVRYPDFSGDLIDQSLLNHVIAGIADARDSDPASTAAVGSLTRLRDECRQAKERLSADTAAVIPAELPGFNSDVRVTRAELERLIGQPLGGLVNAVEETLQRYRIPLASVSAVATVGGGAAVPLVTQSLSERLRAPVVTTPAPQLVAATGATAAAASGFGADAPTGMGPVADAPTGLAPTMGWVAGAPQAGPPPAGPPQDATASAASLAWSQDEPGSGEPVPYAGGDYPSDYVGPTDARPQVAFAHEEEDDLPDSEPLAWYKRPPILFGVAAAAVLLAIGGLAVTLTSTSGPSTPVTENVTLTRTGSDGSITTTVVPASSSSTEPNNTGTTTTTATASESPSSTTSTTSPTTTTTTSTTPM
jgi:Hsp70 protein